MVERRKAKTPGPELEKPAPTTDVGSITALVIRSVIAPPERKTDAEKAPENQSPNES